eukprot:4120583-Amphidinium_carterae.1
MGCSGTAAKVDVMRLGIVLWSLFMPMMPGLSHPRNVLSHLTRSVFLHNQAASALPDLTMRALSSPETSPGRSSSFGAFGIVVVAKLCLLFAVWLQSGVNVLLCWQPSLLEGVPCFTKYTCAVLFLL